MDRKQRGEEIRRLWGPFQGQLLESLVNGIPTYHWEQEGKFSERRQEVDILGRPQSQGFVVAIELERDRATCARNIVKLWMHLDNKPENMLLLQVFSPVFVKDKSSWREEAEFLGGKAGKDTGGVLYYQQIVLETWPAENPNILPELTSRIRNMIS